MVILLEIFVKIYIFTVSFLKSSISKNSKFNLFEILDFFRQLISLDFIYRNVSLLRCVMDQLQWKYIHVGNKFSHLCYSRINNEHIMIGTQTTTNINYMKTCTTKAIYTENGYAAACVKIRFSCTANIQMHCSVESLYCGWFAIK